jgi:hypothetical protein
MNSWVTFKSTQIKSLCKQIKRSRYHFLRFFAELAVKLIVRVHPTLKCLRGGRPIKELSRDPQSADPITSGPGGTNLVGLANARHGACAREYANCR